MQKVDYRVGLDYREIVIGPWRFIDNDEGPKPWLIQFVRLLVGQIEGGDMEVQSTFTSIDAKLAE